MNKNHNCYWNDIDIFSVFSHPRLQQPTAQIMQFRATSGSHPAERHSHGTAMFPECNVMFTVNRRCPQCNAHDGRLIVWKSGQIFKDCEVHCIGGQSQHSVKRAVEMCQHGSHWVSHLSGNLCFSGNSLSKSHEILMFVCLQKDAKQCCDVSKSQLCSLRWSTALPSTNTMSTFEI